MNTQTPAAPIKGELMLRFTQDCKSVECHVPLHLIENSCDQGGMLVRLLTNMKDALRFDFKNLPSKTP